MKVSSHLVKKKIYIRVIFAGILLFQFVALPQTVSGQSKSSTVNDNKEQSHYYKNLIEQIKKVDYATQCARNAVEAFADSAFLPELLFQLSEWEIQREKLYYELAMIKYDYQLELYESGKLTQEPAEPSLSFENALNINQQIIDKYPEVP
ncbi:MAG: hypothetical protein JSW07_18475, partial [bacterium]